MLSNNLKCKICDKAQIENYKPFCSARCADVDLARWLNNSYTIPAVDADGEIDNTENKKNDPK